MSATSEVATVAKSLSKLKRLTKQQQQTTQTANREWELVDFQCFSALCCLGASSLAGFVKRSLWHFLLFWLDQPAVDGGGYQMRADVVLLEGIARAGGSKPVATVQRNNEKLFCPGNIVIEGFKVWIVHLEGVLLDLNVFDRLRVRIHIRQEIIQVLLIRLALIQTFILDIALGGQETCLIFGFRNNRRGVVEHLREREEFSFIRAQVQGIRLRISQKKDPLDSSAWTTT